MIEEDGYGYRKTFTTGDDRTRNRAGSGAGTDPEAGSRASQSARTGAGTGVIALPPTSPIKSSGIRLGEIEAWRLWHVEGHRLRSITREILWLPGVPMTGDPKPTNHAGVYAFRNRINALLEMNLSRNLVLGTVKLWGRYVEHELGFRAENARITALEFGPYVDLKSLRTLYFGRQVPEGLTPVLAADRRVVGVTSAIPAREGPMNILEPAKISYPYPLEDPILNTVYYRTFRIALVNRRLSVVLSVVDDPTILPGWLPL